MTRTVAALLQPAVALADEGGAPASGCVLFVRRLQATSDESEANALIRDEFGLADEPSMRPEDKEAFYRSPLSRSAADHSSGVALILPCRMAFTKARWSRRAWSAYSTAKSAMASSNTSLAPM